MKAFCGHELSRLAVPLVLAAGSLGTLFVMTPDARAGVGLAMVLDMPAEVRMGETGLDGTLTLRNMNSDRDEGYANLVFQITLTPSCGARSVSGDCPMGWEDPDVFTVDSVATGREGSACEGTAFAVNLRNPETGEVSFDPPNGYVTLGPASGAANDSGCIIDFSFALSARPTKDSKLTAPSGTPQRRGTETAAHAGAFIVSTGGMRLGVGGNFTTFHID